MALEKEEMNRRRQERELRKQQQIREQRALILKLILAGVLIVLCGVGIFFLTRSSGDSQTGETGTVESLPPESTAPAETRGNSIFNRDPTTVIHIRAAGDLNVTDSVVNSGISLNGYNYTAAFRDVAPVLADADLTVMNFEGNLSGIPYGTKTTSAPQEMANALRSAGVDILQAANSCTVNNGLLGLQSTLSGIRAAGIEPAGAYATVNEFRRSKGYTICEVQGIRVGVVAFTKGVGSRGLPAGSEDCVNLLYSDYATNYKKIDQSFITQIMKNVAAEDPDITVVLLHWGSEYNDSITASQEKIVSLLQKQGADVIIGTHPHLVHEITYDQKTGNLVAYSLGDFFGDGVKGGTNYSIVLDVEITMDNETGKTRVTDFSYIPVFTLKEDECDGQRRVVRIAEAMKAYEENFVDSITKSAYDSMKTALERIADRVVRDWECESCGKTNKVDPNQCEYCGKVPGK